MKRMMLGSLLAAALAAAASVPAFARTEIIVNVAPPALRYEVVPAPRVGFVWIPGYWDWRYGRYHWVAGHWNRHRPGHVYEPVRWVVRDGKYYRHGGGWRDSDRDGVPDKFDRAPGNPYRR